VPNVTSTLTLAQLCSDGWFKRGNVSNLVCQALFVRASFMLRDRLRTLSGYIEKYVTSNNHTLELVHGGHGFLIEVAPVSHYAEKLPYLKFYYTRFNFAEPNNFKGCTERRTTAVPLVRWPLSAQDMITHGEFLTR